MRKTEWRKTNVDKKFRITEIKCYFEGLKRKRKGSAIDSTISNTKLQIYPISLSKDKIKEKWIRERKI